MQLKPELLIMVLLISGLLTADIAAKVYRWVDENGDVHYSESPPPDSGDKSEDVISAPPAKKSHSSTGQTSSNSGYCQGTVIFGDYTLDAPRVAMTPPVFAIGKDVAQAERNYRHECGSRNCRELARTHIEAKRLTNRLEKS